MAIQEMVERLRPGEGEQVALPTIRVASHPVTFLINTDLDERISLSLNPRQKVMLAAATALQITHANPYIRRPLSFSTGELEAAVGPYAEVSEVDEIPGIVAGFADELIEADLFESAGKDRFRFRANPLHVAYFLSRPEQSFEVSSGDVGLWFSPDDSIQLTPELFLTARAVWEERRDVSTGTRVNVSNIRDTLGTEFRYLTPQLEELIDMGLLAKDTRYYHVRTDAFERLTGVMQTYETLSRIRVLPDDTFPECIVEYLVTRAPRTNYKKPPIQPKIVADFSETHTVFAEDIDSEHITADLALAVMDVLSARIVSQAVASEGKLQERKEPLPDVPHIGKKRLIGILDFLKVHPLLFAAGVSQEDTVMDVIIATADLRPVRVRETLLVLRDRLPLLAEKLQLPEEMERYVQFIAAAYRVEETLRQMGEIVDTGLVEGEQPIPFEDQPLSGSILKEPRMYDPNSNTPQAEQQRLFEGIPDEVMMKLVTFVSQYGFPNILRSLRSQLPDKYITILTLAEEFHARNIQLDPKAGPYAKKNSQIMKKRLEGAEAIRNIVRDRPLTIAVMRELVPFYTAHYTKKPSGFTNLLTEMGMLTMQIHRFEINVQRPFIRALHEMGYADLAIAYLLAVIPQSMKTVIQEIKQEEEQI